MGHRDGSAGVSETSTWQEALLPITQHMLNIKDSPALEQSSGHVSLHPALLLGQHRVAEVV